MFYHYPTSHSSRLAPSLLSLNKPVVYLFEQGLEEPDTPAIETSKDGQLVGVKGDDHKVLSSYRGANVYIEDTEDKYTISFDLPGVKIQDVKLQVKDSVLHVTAERKAGDKTVAKLAQHFALDENLVDPALLRASLTDGVLTITAPKKEEPAPVVVSIQTSEPPAVDEAGLHLTLDVPGIKASDMKVEFHKGKLSVSGERIKTSVQGKRQIVSKVNRYFQIKEKLLDSLKIQAFLSDGVLTVTAPPKPVAPAKQIEIPASTSKEIEAVSEPEPKKDDTADEIVVETVTQEDEQ